MAKTESTLKNMVLTLFLVTLIASSVLAFFNELTREPIRQARLAKQLEALRMVLPDFDNSPVEEVKSVTPEGSGYALEVYPAQAGDEPVGLAVRSYTKAGYSGEFWIMVGFNPDGTINNTAVLQHEETPGLGSKMTGSFKTQFAGLHPEKDDISVGGEIDAITAATISSKAFCDATRRAYEAFKLYKEEHQN